MTEAPLQLFAKQKRIYPKHVGGRFRRIRWIAMTVLLCIYYLVPWIRWDRGEGVPNQAVLIDMSATRAYFFGIEIWPQEVYYITGILILAAVGLFFVTSLFGRVWCGYACPQTVWTDLFIAVERLVQGDRNARMKLDAAPLSFAKLAKKAVTHILWILIGLCTGGAWVFYFNDAPTLFDQIMHFNVPWSVSGWILGLTFSTYLMAGYAREQVCTYMCPYARFQSAMFDKNTLIIAYDEARGEPRGKWKTLQSQLAKQQHAATLNEPAQGHCIDCDSCVLVCPMGIDIRKGLQMECIACGLCIDACDSVMDKLALPRGLIRYDTESKTAFTIFRIRYFWYAGIIALVGTLMLYTLLTRSPLDLNVIHDRNPLYVTLSDGTVRNGYDVHIINKSHEDMTLRLDVTGLEHATLQVKTNQAVAADNLHVFAGSMGQFRVFITAPVQDQPRNDITFIVKDAAADTSAEESSVFMSR